MRRRGFIRKSLIAGSAGLTGCLGGESGNSEVVMTGDLNFSPSTATISSGRIVKWVNNSSVDHTVTAYMDRIPEGARYFASGGFSSEQKARARVIQGLIPPGGEYSHRFNEEGIYEYFCIPHESSGMKGKIRVKK